MKIKDKFLLVLSVGVIGLIATTFWIIQKSATVTYNSINTPEAVTHDFMLAIIQEDYALAYSYLSTKIENYPNTIEEFKYDIQTNLWIEDRFDSFAITEVILGSEEATVIVSLIEFYQGDLFSSGENTYHDSFLLKLENDSWKIYDSQYFFPYCWNGIENCLER